MFKTKKDYFFITLEQITDNILTTTQKFATDVHDLSNTSLFAKEMKDLEHKGDKFTHEIIKELNKRFITPIDRQDILKLVTSLDDIIDDIEAIASRFDLYKLRKLDQIGRRNPCRHFTPARKKLHKNPRARHSHS